MSEQPNARLRHLGSLLLWYGVPAFALANVVAYILMAIVWHVNPPVVPVEGVSMRPTLQAGDLIFLKGVEPGQLHKGDIVAVNVPKEAQVKYSLPGRVVHRIVKIERTATGLVFQTKGDANSGPDVFTVPAQDIVGRMVGKAPGLGYPLLFFRSTQGKILIGAVLLVGLLYLGIGLFETRQSSITATVVGMQTVLDQTEEIKRALAKPPAPEQATEIVAARTQTSRHDEETIRELVGAVAEYGEHLRSHTAVMQGLAETTAQLRLVTEELRKTIQSPASVPSSTPAPGPAPVPPTTPVVQPLEPSPSVAQLSEPSPQPAAFESSAPPSGWTPAQNLPRAADQPSRFPGDERSALVLMLLGTAVTAVYVHRRLKHRNA